MGDVMTRKGLHLWAAAAATAAFMVAAAPRIDGQRDLTRSLFLSVQDENGAPLPAFTTDDLQIREDNTDRRVVAVKPASQPISVALLVDTAKIEDSVQDVRTVVRAF